MLRWLWVSLVVIVSDQMTKLWAESYLAGRRPVSLAPHLDFRLAYNQGAAFSFLSEAGGWQRWFFSVIAVVVSVVLALWLRRLGPDERLTAFGVALVIGGALGNLIDRVAYGHVIDFIDVYYDQTLHWPAFNVADSAITVGVALLLLDSFRQSRSRK